MTETRFVTKGGLRATRQETRLPAVSALDDVWSAIDRRKGGLLVSNYEVPNRYARWDIGFINPPLELTAKGRRFYLRALNPEGEGLLPALAPALADHPHLAAFHVEKDCLHGEVIPAPRFFPEEERSRQPSFFSVLRALLDHLAGDQGELGFYGAFGFDLVFQFETLEQRMARHPDQVDCCLYFPTELVVVDRQKETATRIRFQFQTDEGGIGPAGGGKDQPAPPVLPPAPMASDHLPGEFEKKVDLVREGCRKGDYFEVVLSQTFSSPCDNTPTQIFRRVCQNNPSPYSFLINMGEEHLVGASPEMFVRVVGDRVETSPISGTVPVGDSPMETADHIKQLLGSEKEESELTMCSDVDRNDMTRVCKPGSVKLIGRRLIETYSRLVHTVDHVEGILAPGFDGLDAFTTHLWAATVTGSPKPMALRTIEALENTPRRWYSGAVGFAGVNGNMNTGMTLRTIHLEKGMASVRAGATLLYDSIPALEERETRIKASAFLEAMLGDPSPTAGPGGPDRDRLPGKGKRVLFVDFLDSFVHTLASYVRVTGAEVMTVRVPFPHSVLDEFKPDLMFLSPGPGTPEERGVGDVVRLALDRGLPLFGVCLGHQGMAQVFGAQLGVLETPVHGKPGTISHRGQGVFQGLPNPFGAARYHSLYVKREGLPPELEVLAESGDGVIMALRHKTLPICTVQFHPESILTLKEEVGQRLIENLFSVFLKRRGD